jgi:hypothetical protein
VRVPDDAATVQDALDMVSATGGIVELQTSVTFNETPIIRLNGSGSTGLSLQVRAAPGTRPVLRLSGDLLIYARENDQVLIDGIMVAGGNVCVPKIDSVGASNALNRLSIVHSTITPGYVPAGSSGPPDAAQCELIVEPSDVSVSIDHSIVGPVAVDPGSTLSASDSIIDGGGMPDRAVGAVDGSAGGDLYAVNCTIIGTVATRIMQQVSNSIIFASGNAGGAELGPVCAQRIQEGCVRFSYVPSGSRAPRRYRCVPSTDVPEAAPVFESLRFGDPGYCRLHRLCPSQIARGADDEAEMGVYHELLQPQRETNLRERLEEYVRFGLEAGIFYTT